MHRIVAVGWIVALAGAGTHAAGPARSAPRTARGVAAVDRAAHTGASVGSRGGWTAVVVAMGCARAIAIAASNLLRMLACR